MFILLASFIALHFSSTLVCFSSLFLVYLSCVFFFFPALQSLSGILSLTLLEFFKTNVGQFFDFVEVLGS